ncbi:MAG: hypothetical protein AB7F74_30535 [Parvibaculaceae bacterium]
MTDLCDPSPGDSGREKERDAPAIANMPSIWRWLRALSTLRLKPPRPRQRAIGLHFMNDHLLKDIGLARMDDEDAARRCIWITSE